MARGRERLIADGLGPSAHLVVVVEIHAEAGTEGAITVVLPSGKRVRIPEAEQLVRAGLRAHRGVIMRVPMRILRVHSPRDPEDKPIGQLKLDPVVGFRDRSGERRQQ